MAVSGFFKRILFLTSFCCKAMLGIGGRRVKQITPNMSNFYINWWLGICMWVAPHVDPILCYHFFGWIQIFREYHFLPKFVTSGKYMGVTLAEIWNLQENFDYLPHVSLLEFLFQKIHIYCICFARFFCGVMSFGWPKTKISRKQETNQGHRLQSLGAFPDHPMYPVVVSKFDTWWSYSGRTQGT